MCHKTSRNTHRVVRLSAEKQKGREKKMEGREGEGEKCSEELNVH